MEMSVHLVVMRGHHRLSIERIVKILAMIESASTISARSGVRLQNDIVVRVSIIRNQATSIIVAAKLYCDRVDLVDRSQNRLTVKLNDCLSLRYGCGSNHWVDRWVNLHMTSN